MFIATVFDPIDKAADGSPKGSTRRDALAKCQILPRVVRWR